MSRNEISEIKTKKIQTHYDFNAELPDYNTIVYSRNYEEMEDSEETTNLIIDMLELQSKVIHNIGLKELTHSVKIYNIDGHYVWVDVDVKEEYKKRFFGKKYVNISCLKRMFSNVSGRTGKFLILNMI